ncbi:hypothetical protein Tco_0347645 [Tanacetum coccineum]
MRRFQGMDDEKEISESLRTRFGGNAKSKEMRRLLFKTTLKHLHIQFRRLKGYGTDSNNYIYSVWKLMVLRYQTKGDANYNKSNTNKVKSGFTGAYSTCTPSTSSINIFEKEVLAGFADEVIYSLFAKQSEDWDSSEDLEQLMTWTIEEFGHKNCR